MSVKASTWAWEQSVQTHADKLVLLALADHANDDGYAWPGKTTISEKTDVHPKTVQAALRRLEDRGLISIESRFKAGRQTTNGYQLHMRGEGSESLPPGERHGEGEGSESLPPGDHAALPHEPLEEPSGEPDDLVLSFPDVEEDQHDADEEVFEYWRTERARVLGKNGGPMMTPTKTRMSKIRARLKEGYTVEMLKEAVDGCLSREYNVENGYTDIELICRNQGKVEQFRAHAKKKAEEPGSDGWAEEERRRLLGEA